MDLTKIVSISGKSGLFRIVSQGKNAVIVESLTDQKRFPAFGHEKMSSLEEISIFTTAEDRPLKEVLKAFHEKLQGGKAPDPKSDNKTLKEFFLEVVPDYDQERVYVSDIRKMAGWYNMLLERELLDFSETEEGTAGEEKPGDVTDVDEGGRAADAGGAADNKEKPEEPAVPEMPAGPGK